MTDILRTIFQRPIHYAFEAVPNWIGNFQTFVSDMFPMLSEDVVVILLFGFCLMVAIGIIKWATGR
jgi:hypothetical protein